MQPLLTIGPDGPVATGRMEVIQVHPRPHDLNKLPKRVASYGQAGLIGRQVAGDDDRRTCHRRTKTSAPPKYTVGSITAVWPKYGLSPGKN